MDIQKHQLGDVSVVEVSGELDYRSYVDFQNDIFAMLEEGASKVAIGLGEATFMDSAGLLTFIRINRRLRERGGKLVVFDVPPVMMSQLFEFSGLNQVIHIVDTKTDALQTPAQSPE